MNRVIFIILAMVLSLLITGETYSFEVDWFKSGMSFEEVQKQCNKLNFDKVDITEDSISAYDLPLEGNARHYTLFFCKNRLVTVQKEFNPTIKTFIMKLEEFIRYYGRQFVVNAHTSIIGTGQQQSRMNFFWKKRNTQTSNDRIELSYIVFERNDQMYVLYQAQNTCFDIWR